MHGTVRLATVLGSAILTAAAASLMAGQLIDSPNSPLALVSARIYVSPTDPPIENGTVLIAGTAITRVGRRTEVKVPRSTPSIDCSGLTIAAGFWNSHAHVFERKWTDAASIPAPELGQQLQDMFTRYGFTSVFDTGSLWQNTRRLRDRIESGEVPGPRIRSTGEPMLAAGAAASERVLSIMGLMAFPVREITDAAQASAAARTLLDEGVDGIKVHLQKPQPPNPPFPLSALPAVVDEAHRAGRPVFLHPNTGDEVSAAIRAGVDVIAHTTPQHGPWTETVLAAVQERRPALTPTLTLWKHFLRHDRASMQQRSVRAAIGQLRGWISSGGTVLFGNDVGAVEYDPTDEYVLMADAGMSPRQILASLTTAPAGRFGDGKERGRVAAGFQADLVVLKSDPAQNVRAFGSVQYTLRAGKVVYRAGT